MKGLEKFFSILFVGNQGLGIVAGLQNGGLVVWTMHDLTLNEPLAMEQSMLHGKVHILNRVHGSLPLTAALWTTGPENLNGGCEGRLVSCGLAKEVKTWKLLAEKVSRQKVIPDALNCAQGHNHC